MVSPHALRASLRTPSDPSDLLCPLLVPHLGLISPCAAAGLCAMGLKLLGPLYRAWRLQTVTSACHLTTQLSSMTTREMGPWQGH